MQQVADVDCTARIVKLDHIIVKRHFEGNNVF